MKPIHHNQKTSSDDSSCKHNTIVEEEQGGGGSHCLNCGQLTSCCNSNVSAVVSSSDANEKPVKAMDELGIYKHSETTVN